MRTGIANWSRLALVVMVVSGTQVGCKSGWKMPGSSMFSWNKKPSESALAGSNPSITTPTTSSSALAANGSSPASRNTPSLLSSTGRTSPYGNNTQPTASPYSAPNGAVASANGYQTGPYSTTAGARPTGYTASTGYGPTANTGAPTGIPGAPANNFAMAGAPRASGMPNGGMPVAGLPNSNMTGGLPTAGLPAPNVANQNGMVGNAFGLPPASPSTPTTSLANAPAYSQPAAQYSTMGLPPSTAGNIPAMPVGMSSTNMASLPMGQPSPGLPPSSMPNAIPAGYTTSQPTMYPGASSNVPAASPAYAGATPYRPGSTGRSTAYDFSQPSSGTSVPQTANGPANPSTNMYR